MGFEDKLREVKEMLETSLSELKAVIEGREHEGVRVGSGWDPLKIPVKLYVLKGKPLHEILKIAESMKRSLFAGKLSILIGKHKEATLMGRPSIIFQPYWMIKGFHECFYFRGRSYKIEVPEDVQEVRVDGKVRELRAEPRRKLGPLSLSRLFGGRLKRYFIVDNVTELVREYRQKTLMLNASGKEDAEMALTLSGNIELMELSREEDLNIGDFELIVQRPSADKAQIVERLRRAVVKPPSSFKKILTNRFEVTELAIIYAPRYVFRYTYDNVEKEVVLDGLRGDLISLK